VATGFFTDSSVCIGCKACEVACKEWNGVPGDGLTWTGTSYDNTSALGHATWRHVKFVEDARDGMPTWDFSSDVCKHCEHAGCLEACPTGSIVRTEFGGVFVQPDVCNGCGYCVVSCPFGVVDRRPDDGRAFKCTFCYDRQKAGLTPACAKACPTESIQFGDLEELRTRAEARLATLAGRGVTDASIYDPQHSSVGGTHAIFLVRGNPARYNLPADPEVPTVHLARAWRGAAIAAAIMLAATWLAVSRGSGLFSTDWPSPEPGLVRASAPARPGSR
jgi:formate dehydrogenase iron-sulfur subunit